MEIERWDAYPVTNVGKHFLETTKMTEMFPKRVMGS